MEMRVTLLTLGFIYVILISYTGAQFWDLQGDYCRTRRPTRCCPNRDDTCTVPILGTLCYCDEFCNRTNGADCCPDFWPVCMGIPRPDIILRNKCNYEGKSYEVGHSIKVNCNKCTCKQLSPVKFDFVCEEKVCLVRPELIHSVNSGDYGWRASNYSFFWGKTLDEGIRYRLGTFKPTRPTMNMHEINIKMKDKLPDNFDSRQRWHGLIQPVRDQGDCGASWAFSSTALAADRLAIQSLGTEKMALSPQQLISCQNKVQRGCHGGHVDRAWWFMRKRGVASEKCYPYESGSAGDEGICLVRKSIGRHGHILCPTGGEERIHHSTPPYRVGPKEEEIMQEIYNNGPVQATFKVHDDFFLYRSGIYRYSRVSEHLPEPYQQHGWHSIRIIGWGVDRTGHRPVKYWLCANSWGRLWGEDGYFRIVRGQDECDIEMFIVGVWAKRNDMNGINAIGM